MLTFVGLSIILLENYDGGCFVFYLIVGFNDLLWCYDFFVTCVHLKKIVKKNKTFLKMFC